MLHYESVADVTRESVTAKAGRIDTIRESADLFVGIQPSCVQPALLLYEPAEYADTNWHVQPETLGEAETGLKKNDYEQDDTGAGHAGGCAAPPPQDDGYDSLHQCSKLQRKRNAPMDSCRVIVSRQEEPCGYCLNGYEPQINVDQPPDPLDPLSSSIGDCRDS
jgi:hypothetical protein